MSNDTTGTITCEELQQAMRGYCERHGIEVIEKPASIDCQLPGSAKLRIYNRPHVSGIYTLYGLAFCPWRKFKRSFYFDTKSVIYLKQKFDERNNPSDNKEE
jgi:hypothetical protein